MLNFTTSVKIMLNILYFGVIPTYLALQKDWVWWLGYAISVIVYYFLSRSYQHIMAATNIVMAKVTYANLSEDDKLEVDEIANIIITAQKSDPQVTYENEFEELAYLALAMRNLGIRPDIYFSSWFSVKDPSKLPSEKWIATMIKITSKKLESMVNPNAVD